MINNLNMHSCVIIYTAIYTPDHRRPWIIMEGIKLNPEPIEMLFMHIEYGFGIIKFTYSEAVVN